MSFSVTVQFDAGALTVYLPPSDAITKRTIYLLFLGLFSVKLLAAPPMLVRKLLEQLSLDMTFFLALRMPYAGSRSANSGTEKGEEWHSLAWHLRCTLSSPTSNWAITKKLMTPDLVNHCLDGRSQVKIPS